jgi:hypothetical protein
LSIFFTANSDGQSDGGFGIYELDLITGLALNLTSTPIDWGEHAQYPPDGKHIAWMSSIGLEVEIASVANYAWQETLDYYSCGAPHLFQRLWLSGVSQRR